VLHLTNYPTSIIQVHGVALVLVLLGGQRRGGRGNGDGAQHPWELSFYLVDARVMFDEMLYSLELCSFVYFIIFVCS
jgi:hypothetical protein